MIKEAEITDQTGILYLREGISNSTGPVFCETVNLLKQTLSHAVTSEDTRPKLNVQPKISQSSLLCNLLSSTTGCELRDIDIVLVLEMASDHVATDYHIAFEFKGGLRTRSHTKYADQVSSPDINSASTQSERLREISGLKIERLAEIFGVSRTTYSKWISGSRLHDTHREHLLEVLSLVKEAAQRLGSPSATNTWLLTPVSPGGKKPIDYLAERQYSIFRGFLLRVRTGHEVFRSLAPSSRVHKERSQEEVDDARERLRPRVWRDEDDVVDSSGIDE